jgi:myo-inositol-1(or 4)-monophosphatase
MSPSPEMVFIESILRDLWDTVDEGHRRAAELEIEVKKEDAADLVTQFDLAVQQRIEMELGRRFADDQLMGEEAGRDKPPGDPMGRCWLVDPIDGTHNFARGMVGAFGISIAFAEGGQVQAAGIALPTLGELFLAQRGSGATRNGRPTRVSSINHLEAARVELDFARLPTRSKTLQVVTPLFTQVSQIRVHGSCIVSMAAVAAGGAEAFIHAAPSPWDYAAGLLIIQEAGGTVTQVDGSPLFLFDASGGILASNSVLHNGIRRIISPRAV